jgi:hypothetical protein
MSTPDPFALGGADPLLALWAERSRIRAQYETVPEDGYGGLVDRLGDELDRIEEQMETMIPISIAGALAQLRLLRFYHEIDYDNDGRVVDNLIAGLEQLGEGGAT